MEQPAQEDNDYINEQFEEEIEALEAIMIKEKWKDYPKYTNPAIKLLRYTLRNVLGDKDASLKQMLANQGDYQFKVDMSRHLTAALDHFKWTSKKYISNIMTTFRKVLKKLPCEETFITQVKVTFPVIYRNSLLPSKYSKLPKEHATASLLGSWIETLRDNTQINSDVALRNMMYFFIQICTKLALDPDHWPSDHENTIKSLTHEKILGICGDLLSSSRRANWLQLFIKLILKSEFTLPKRTTSEIAIRVSKIQNKAFENDDGSDHHRIGTKDLESLYKASVADTFDELFFLLLITTGMRVGGLVKIKTEHVATLIEGKWVTNKAKGRTSEKGRKWFTFLLNPRVSELIAQWLNTIRPTLNSPYLFCGRDNGHISTKTINLRFKKLCVKVGLNGEEHHPHALRHSYAHMLLEIGNTTEVVSKLLGHSNVATTEKYYLRESAGEIAKRANIPWQDTDTSDKPKEDMIPSFLKKTRETNQVINKKKRKRSSIKQQKASLAMLNLD